MIPVYRPSITDLEKKYVMDCMESSWISSKGEYIDLFEGSFKEKTGIGNATSVCNGTVALHLAMLSLGIGEGDEVIVPSLTYIASVNAITYVGAKPVFADSLLQSWQLDPKSVLEKITSRTRAIMVVHLYGQSCDMDSLRKIADDHNLFIIEDCAEAFGTTFNGIHAGNIGDIATFSFFGNKTITTGEGGMVASNNKDLLDKVVRLKSQGLAAGRQYWHDIVGYNYRMTNLACAIGLAQIQRSEEIMSKKLYIADRYRKAFNESRFIFHEEVPETHHSYWMCSILVPENINRDELASYLLSKGIETRPVFYPVHTMPIYEASDTLVGAETISKLGINLPSFPDLTDDQISYITNTILEYP